MRLPARSGCGGAAGCRRPITGRAAFCRAQQLACIIYPKKKGLGVLVLDIF